MTTDYPPTCRIDTKRGHTYQIHGQPEPGLTTFLKLIDANGDGLRWGAVRQTVQHASTPAQLVETLRLKLDNEHQQLAKHLNDQGRWHQHQWDTKRDLGTVVHAHCETYLNTGQIPGDTPFHIASHLKAFAAWIDATGAEPLHVETPFFREPDTDCYGYGCTADLWLTLNGATVIADLKTGRVTDKPGRVQLKHLCQLSGIAHTHYHLTGQQPSPTPAADYGLVIDLKPGKCVPHRTDLPDAHWQIVKAARTLWHHLHNHHDNTGNATEGETVGAGA